MSFQDLVQAHIYIANLNRMEKDRNFNYFWVRCIKLICVSNLNNNSPPKYWYPLQCDMWWVDSVIVGNNFCCALCRLFLLSHCCTLSWSKGYMDWRIHGRFCSVQHMDSICDVSLLGYHHLEYCGLWWFAPGEQIWDAFWHFLHALQSWTHFLLDWEHDQLGGLWK